MKVVLLGDTHAGCRGGSQHFNEFFEEFYSNIFFPYLIQHGIQAVFQLGDIFDSRRHTNHLSLSEFSRYFFRKFDEYDIQLITLLGNHDLYYKESLSVSSSELFLNQFKNITVINKPTRLSQYNISMIPWICKENYTECLDFIKTDTSSICLGHFDISGFKMYQNSISSEHGLSNTIFSNYEDVYSGHFHHRSQQGNIEYIGTPYEMNWQDYDDQKGFYVLDLESKTKEFIKNPYSIYLKFDYDDIEEGDVSTSEYLNPDFLQQFDNKYVKIKVDNKTNPYLFDLFIDALNTRNILDLSIIEDSINFDLDTEVDESKDTLSITYNYIDNIKQTDLDGNKLKSIMSELYNEALAIE